MNVNDFEIQLGARLLLQLASALNWILKHEITDISFDRLIKDFGKALGADSSFLCIREVCNNQNIDYKLQNVWCKNADSDYFFSHLNSIDLNELPFLSEVLEGGNSIFMSVEKMPSKSKVFLEGLGIKFIACTPISKPDGITIWGLFGFSASDVEHQWTDLESAALTAIGAVMGTLVYRLEEVKKRNYDIKEQTARVREFRKQIDETIELTAQKLHELQTL